MNRDYEEDAVGRSRARSRKKPSAKETREKNVSESSKRSRDDAGAGEYFGAMHSRGPSIKR